MKRNKKTILIISSLILLVFQLTSCYATEPNIDPLSVEEERVEIPKEYVAEHSKSAGIINTNGQLSLDKKYNPVNNFLIYYGRLDMSKISDYSKYDFMIVSDTDFENVSKVRAQGCKIFQYIAFGSNFQDTDVAMNNIKREIDLLKSRGLADGIFLDECDIAYWERNAYSQPDKVKIFYDRLKEVTEYTKHIGFETVVNGSRAYAELGDYYLWEDYLTYWESNALKWSSIKTGREINENGVLNYGLMLSDWHLEGSCKFDGESIVDGANGAIDITIDMDKMVLPQDQKSRYDWGYFEWFGSGATDETCKVEAWIGEALPFNETTWEKLSDAYKGRPRYWNGIDQNSKYLKLRMTFNGASDLKIKDILLTFGYTYDYWDMSKNNEEEESNPHIWNYNNAKRDYLLEKVDEKGNAVKVLTHTFGDEGDENKNMYTYLTSKIWNYYAYDYVHPNMQIVYNTEKMDNPIGLLLKREGENKGYFTGAVATVDLYRHTYDLEREEPAYWYDKAIQIDGNFDDWTNVDVCYESPKQVEEIKNESWYIDPENYSDGQFNNIEIIDDDGYGVLKLIEKGVGTWISPVISADDDENKVIMKEINWDGGGEGSIDYYIQYKKYNGEWTDWIDISKSNDYKKINFVAFKVKIKLEGVPSYVETVTWEDDEGEPFYEDVEHDGISFWGSEHKWGTYANNTIKKISITDDRKNMYVAFESEEEIKFDKEDGNKYIMFIDVYGDYKKGYKQDQWEKSSGVNFKVENDKFFVWNDDRGRWIENEESTIIYKLSENKKKIEYCISKEALDGLDKANLKLYMQVENMKNGAVVFIPSITNEEKSDILYSQKNYEMKIPHGWYTSNEMVLNEETKTVTLKWKEKKPSNTNIKTWIRTRKQNENWTDWIEVKNEEKVNTENAIRYQYCFGLYTNDGKNTPVVDKIQVK
ncbi:hypothetical protein [Marinisporobacter balticus]|uniref:Uncharacterized protein n=1 Tax=Marinisporobacter balticus TaxID=2018667 RepID=A0A4V2SA06_9FIRM|nr:hypothetical protein [Marinisporobacter balticus]TCO69830.1 hypothetical protein EV214_1292 [Marinisporobacter balticus]